MLYIIDSYAWIEYFRGSRKGEQLRELFLDEGNTFLTIECCLAVIKGWALRQGKNFTELWRVVRANSRLVALTELDWIAAAEERFTQRKTRAGFGLIDATLLVKQKEFNCQVISGDPHFKGLPHVLFMDG